MSFFDEKMHCLRVVRLWAINKPVLPPLLLLLCVIEFIQDNSQDVFSVIKSILYGFLVRKNGGMLFDLRSDIG